jgi:pimeloyl-ACP methyl ester carboxylesterase
VNERAFVRGQCPHCAWQRAAFSRTFDSDGDFEEGFRVHGSQGSVNGAAPLPWFQRAHVECFKDGEYRRLLGEDGFTFRRQIEGFAATILEGASQHGADLDDGIAAMRALVAISQSVASGEPASLADASVPVLSRSGDAAELSFDTLGDDLIGLLNYLGLARAVVGGISMGAGVALNAAMRYPERVVGLVLARPAWLDRPMPRRTLRLFDLLAGLLRELAFSIATDEGLDWAWQKLERDAAFAAIARRFTDTAWSMRNPLTAERAVDGVARLERFPRDQPVADLRQLAALRVPTLVLAHHQDPIHPFAYGMRLAQAIPGARVVEVTSRSVSRERHATEMRHGITAFVRRLSETTAWDLQRAAA